MTTRAGEGRPESFPLATYRLQLHRAFTFNDARAIVPYLHALGITDCYLSPISKAVPGSEHGYDVIDPTVLNPELGTDEEFAEFIATVRAHGMGVILDVVPNHMGITKALNRWWFDVLENGPSSRYASAPAGFRLMASLNDSSAAARSPRALSTMPRAVQAAGRVSSRFSARSADSLASSRSTARFISRYRRRRASASPAYAAAYRGSRSTA